MESAPIPSLTTSPCCQLPALICFGGGLFSLIVPPVFSFLLAFSVDAGLTSGLEATEDTA